MKERIHIPRRGPYFHTVVTEHPPTTWYFDGDMQDMQDTMFPHVLIFRPQVGDGEASCTLRDLSPSTTYEAIVQVFLLLIQAHDCHRYYQRQRTCTVGANRVRWRWSKHLQRREKVRKTFSTLAHWHPTHRIALLGCWRFLPHLTRPYGHTQSYVWQVWLSNAG